MTYQYNVFEMLIRSEIKIDFLEDSSNSYLDIGRTVDIFYSNKDNYEYEDVCFMGMKYFGSMRCYDTSTQTILCYDDNIKLAVGKSGKEILLICEEEYINEGLIYVFTSGIILCQYYMGYSILHASSCTYNNNSYAFLGDSGAGKSTILYNLALSGMKVNADDILVLRDKDNRVDVSPQLMLPCKMWDETLNKLNYKENQKIQKGTKELLPGMGKYWVYLIDEKKNSVATKINTIFILKPMPTLEISIKKPTSVEAFEHVVKNFHALWCLPNDVRNKQIKFISTLLKNVNVVYLEYPKDYKLLPTLINKIIDHIE